MTQDSHRAALAAAAGAGALAGMRSTAAPAVMAAWTFSTGPRPGGPRVERTLARRWVMALLAAAVAGELVFDKLPGTPPRVALGPFAGRVLSGALAGWVVARRFGHSPARATITAGTSAGLSTVASYRIRRNAHSHHVASSTVLGLIEDGVVAAGALLLWRYLVRSCE